MRSVLEHAEELLRRAKEYLEQRDSEAGAAASGAPCSGSAALASLLEGIDAFMDAGSAPKAEDKDDPIPMEGPSKKEESSSEELVPDHPASSPFRQQGAPAVQGGHSRGASGGDPVVPDAEADGALRVPGVRQERGLRGTLAPSPGSVPRGPAPAGGLSGAYEL